MTPDEARSGFFRFGYDVNDTLVAKVIELVEHDPHNLTDDGSGFEIWRPDNWLALNDALHGWDTMSGFGTERDGPYIGPPGVAAVPSNIWAIACWNRVVGFGFRRAVSS